MYSIVWWRIDLRIWSVRGLDRPASLDAFLKEPLFDGKTFWECEKEMEWVDY